MSDITKFISSIEKISSPPSIFVKINELINDPTSSAAKIGAVVEKDQALTSKLLQMVNSAFYALPYHIETVTRAITLIGFNQLRDMVLAVSVRRLFNEFDKDSPITMQSFWEHSIACGIASRVLAVFKGERSAETFFIAGFLHDFGRLVLLENFPKQYKEVYTIVEDEKRPPEEVEKKIFGFDHAEVGAELMKVWNLPESLCDAVALHHDPSKSINHKDLTSVVHIADIVVHAFEFGFSGNPFVPPLDSTALSNSGLKVSMLEPALKKIDEQFQDSKQFLLSN